MAAMLVSVTGNRTKTAAFIDECRLKGIRILRPDVNESDYHFRPEAGGIRYGLSGIRNVGTQAIAQIVQARRRGRFIDLQDFAMRVDVRVVNKRVVDALVQAGACLSLPGNRQQQFRMIDEVMDAAVRYRKDSDALQLSMFGFQEMTNWHVEIPADVPEYNFTQILELERDTLGLFLTGHPLDQYETLLSTAAYPPDPLQEAMEAPTGQMVVVAVMILSMRKTVTKKGQTMAFLQVEDRVTRLEAIVFPRTWLNVGHLLQSGSVVILAGHMQRDEDDAEDDERVKLIVDEVTALDQIHGAADEERVRSKLAYYGKRAGKGRSAPGGGRTRAGAAGTADAKARRSGAAKVAGTSDAKARSGAHMASGVPADTSRSTGQVHPRGDKQQKLWLRIDPDKDDDETWHALKELLRGHAGTMTKLVYHVADKTSIQLNAQYNVKPSPELIASIQALLGVGAAVVR
jgi:DNA polymerase-3 subunit alpha